jgi:hypothetical protein
MKVDGAAPEQPVLDFIGCEQLGNACQRRELLRLVHAVSLAVRFGLSDWSIAAIADSRRRALARLAVERQVVVERVLLMSSPEGCSGMLRRLDRRSSSGGPPRPDALNLE